MKGRRKGRKDLTNYSLNTFQALSTLTAEKLFPIIPNINNFFSLCIDMFGSLLVNR